MKRLLAALSNKWVIGVIGLLALSLVIWFGFGFIKFGADNAVLSPAWRIALIVMAWSIWLAWNISQYLLERKQNQQLLEEIESTPEPQVDQDEVKRGEESEAISQRFRDALDTLRQYKFKSRFGSRSLYQLPWYIIVGPPGSGKTTALTNSGLDFPLAKSHGKEALGGVGGTRNCDWWFTNDAVFIDTAGRFTTQDSHRVTDSSAWQTFLTLLKKYRRRRPINGAIVAISVQDLMVQAAEQQAHQAATLRARIEELHQSLGVRFPIYLVFTKCDLVAGFSEFFSNLMQSEREQVWGISFDSEKDARTGADLNTFPDAFDRLIERLNQRMLLRVNQERNIDTLSVIQSFPSRMESLADTLDSFIKQTFQSSSFDTAPMLRGVYFTSATQEGTPIDRMMAQVCANFGISQSQAQQQQSTGKSFFLSKLLRDVIFPESELVGVNPKVERAMLWLRRGVFASLALAFVSGIVVWSSSLAQNSRSMTAVNDHIAQYQVAKGQYNPRSRALQDILTVLDPLREASLVYNRESHPMLSNLGMYDASVDEAADALYQQELQQVFLPAFSAMIERHLNNLSVQDDSLLPVFKTYMMLFDPEKRDDNSITDYAKTRWESQLPGQASMQAQLLAHLSGLLSEPLPQQAQPNSAVVARTRQQLRSVPAVQRLYAQVKTYGQNPQPIDLYAQIGGDVRSTFGLDSDSDAFSMPFFFTKAGYEASDFSADSAMMQNWKSDQWLYGDTLAGEDFSDADRAKLSEDVKRLYLQEYAARWQRFMQRFALADFSSTEQALQAISQVSDPVFSPLVAIIRVVADNTALTPNLNLDSAGRVLRPSTVAGQAASNAASSLTAKALEPTVVDLRFADLQRMLKSGDGTPSRFEDYLASMHNLNTYLVEIDSAANPNQAAFDYARRRYLGTGNDVIKQVRMKANTAPPAVKAWLNQLADKAWSLVLGKAKIYIDSEWRDQVYRQYQSSLQQRYPMQRGGQTEAPLLDFVDFFKPGGIQAAFVEQYLSAFVDTRRWELKLFEEQGLPLGRGSLSQLKQAGDIRRAFFSGGEVLSVPFSLEPSKLDSSVRLFSLEVGSQRLTYSHGPRTQKSMKWQAAQDNRARFVFEDLNESMHRQQYEGSWAWLKLLDDAKVFPRGDGNTSMVRFELNSREAEFIMRFSTRVDPFDLSLLRDYRCNATL